MLKIINSLYDFDKASNAFIIKLSIKRYLNIFNNYDPYPIRKRDIDQNVINYLEDCSDDISFKSNIILEIKILEEKKDIDLEERTKKGLVNNFLYMYEYYKNENRKIINNSIFYIFTFLVLASFTFWFDSSDLNINRVFIRTVLEGISIGSWVFLWEAIAGLLIKNKSSRKLIKTYNRFMNCKIVFIN